MKVPSLGGEDHEFKCLRYVAIQFDKLAGGGHVLNFNPVAFLKGNGFGYPGEIASLGNCSCISIGAAFDLVHFTINSILDVCQSCGLGIGLGNEVIAISSISCGGISSQGNIRQL